MIGSKTRTRIGALALGAVGLTACWDDQHDFLAPAAPDLPQATIIIVPQPPAVPDISGGYSAQGTKSSDNCPPGFFADHFSDPGPISFEVYAIGQQLGIRIGSASDVTGAYDPATGFYTGMGPQGVTRESISGLFTNHVGPTTLRGDQMHELFDPTDNSLICVAVYNVTYERTMAPANAVFVDPIDATVADGQTAAFTAYWGPRDAMGNPELGPDGTVGTSDDNFTPVSADWVAFGNIGTVSPENGATTDFLGALPDGTNEAQGSLFALYDGDAGGAVIEVKDDPKVPCVDFTSGGGKPVFTRCDRTVVFTFEFTPGTGATATVGRKMIPVPAGDYRFLILNLANEKIVSGEWKGIGSIVPPVKLDLGTGVKTLDLILPTVNAGMIVEASGTGKILTKDEATKNNINGAKVYFTKPPS